MSYPKIGIVLLVAVLFSVTANAQKLRRKYFGNYSGVIASFELVIDTIAVPVSAAPIKVRFEKELNVFVQTIGESQVIGTWTIANKTSNIIFLTVHFPNLAIEENYELHLADKTLIRKGMYPQPKTQLTKD